jgi:hypothetical protein
MSAANTNLLPSGALTDGLRDIRGPVVIPNAWIWIGWALALLAVAALSYWAWRRWRKRLLEPPPIPVIPPHVRAKQKLGEALALIGQPREFCITVSDIVRGYLEGRFEFRAPERTTEEFLVELQGTRLLTPDQKQSLGEFLQRCDLVKFACYEPGRPELLDLHAAAVRLVEETEPLPPTPETGGPPPPADSITASA